MKEGWNSSKLIRRWGTRICDYNSPGELRLHFGSFASLGLPLFLFCDMSWYLRVRWKPFNAALGVQVEKPTIIPQRHKVK